MNKLASALVLLTVFCGLGRGQTSDDATNALAVVNRLFAEMAAANPAGILALHLPEADLVALFKQPNGKSRIHVINGDAFAKMFTDKTKVLKEEMYAPKVEVHGDLAMAWGRYVFFAEGKLSHCGVNTFNLVRTDAGWKIAVGASTIDRNGCTEEEKARRPSTAK